MSREHTKSNKTANTGENPRHIFTSATSLKRLNMRYHLCHINTSLGSKVIHVSLHSGWQAVWGGASCREHTVTGARSREGHLLGETVWVLLESAPVRNHGQWAHLLRTASYSPPPGYIKASLVESGVHKGQPCRERVHKG